MLVNMFLQNVEKVSKKVEEWLVNIVFQTESLEWEM